VRLPLAAQPRRFLCTQFSSQDLTSLALRNVVDNLHLPWVLVPGHPLLAEGDDLLRCGRSCGFERDKGLNRLAEVSIGNTDHGSFCNSWMEQQAFLDLSRRDAELASWAGLDEATIVALEQGQYKPKSHELSQLAEALGVDELELLCRTAPGYLII
jgi:DNA-binding XRE family transcriptional regulator